jgi:hypothetical protein
MMSQNFLAGEEPWGAGGRTCCVYVTWQRQGVCCVPSVSAIRSAVQNLSSAAVDNDTMSSKRSEFISRQLCRRWLVQRKEGKRGKCFWVYSFLWKERRRRQNTRAWTVQNTMRWIVYGCWAAPGELHLCKCCSFHLRGELICGLSGWFLYRSGSWQCVRGWRSDPPPLPTAW